MTRSRPTRLLLSAFPGERDRATSRPRRRGIFELVSSDDERTLLVSVIPIRERGAIDTEYEALVRLVDDEGAEMSKATTHDRLIFIRGSGGTVVGSELGEVGTYDMIA